MKDAQLLEVHELLESLGREGKLVGRFIDAVGVAGRLEGITRDEALSATRRFAAMVEQSVSEIAHAEAGPEETE